MGAADASMDSRSSGSSVIIRQLPVHMSFRVCSSAHHAEKWLEPGPRPAAAATATAAAGVIAAATAACTQSTLISYRSMRSLDGRRWPHLFDLRPRFWLSTQTQSKARRVHRVHLPFGGYCGSHLAFRLRQREQASLEPSFTRFARFPPISPSLSSSSGPFVRCNSAFDAGPGRLGDACTPRDED